MEPFGGRAPKRSQVNGAHQTTSAIYNAAYDARTGRINRGTE